MKNFIRNAASRPALQSTWARLLKLAHAGMNYGGGQTVKESGEVGALQFLNRKFPGPHPFILFDVGANDGEYYRAAESVFDNRLHGYLFEPQEACYKALRAEFSDVYPIALGRTAGDAVLFAGSEGDTQASLKISEDRSAGVSVPVETIDGFCSKHRIPRIDLLKIDTEGFEMDVLLGAKGMLESRAIRSIQFEFGDTYLPSEWHFIDFWNLLSPGYRIFRILRNGLAEIDRHNSDLEIYKIANFLCTEKAGR